MRQINDDRLNPKYKNLRDVVKQIIQNEGITAFYKGTLPPLAGVGACVSIQFGVVENVKRILKRNFCKEGQDLSFFLNFVAGSIAGVANSSVSIPAEHIRIRMQMQTNENQVYKSSIDAFKKIYSRYGLQGIYYGTGVTIARELVGYGVYFAAYAEMMKVLNPSGGMNFIASFLSGGFAGICFWVFSFPLDVAKTRVQSQSFENPIYKGVFDAYGIIQRSEKGIGKWFPGFTVCLMRAIPANGATFAAFELSSKALHKLKSKF